MALLIKQANNGKDLTYDTNVQLLIHTASDYDNIQIKVKGKRQVLHRNHVLASWAGMNKYRTKKLTHEFGEVPDISMTYMMKLP
jgi:hypothetical protein